MLRTVFLVWFGLLGCGDDDARIDAGETRRDSGTASDAGATDAGVAGGSDAGAIAIEPFIAIVDGELAGSVGESQATHDAIAAGGEATARAAGNVHHEVFTGADILGTAPARFLATDRWAAIEPARGLYASPDFQMALASLFTGPPSIVLYEHTDWHQWGHLDAADSASPRYFVLARGVLREGPLDETRSMHDAIASGGEAMARGAGDVAHIVYLADGDPTRFLAIDVWSSPAAIEALYTNPDFMRAFLSLFSEPPTLAIYESTSWHQW